MIHCNQVCMYNFPDDGCLKPKDAVCPLSNIARGTNVITNADHIRSMTDEELGDFLDSIYCHGWNYGAAHRMDGDPDYHEWLKQPYKEDA